MRDVAKNHILEDGERQNRTYLLIGPLFSLLHGFLDSWMNSIIAQANLEKLAPYLIKLKKLSFTSKSQKFKSFNEIFLLSTNNDIDKKIDFLCDIRDIFYHYDFEFDEHHASCPRIILESFDYIRFDPSNYKGWSWNQLVFEAKLIDCFEESIREYFALMGNERGDPMKGFGSDGKIDVFGIDPNYKLSNWISCVDKDAFPIVKFPKA